MVRCGFLLERFPPRLFVNYEECRGIATPQRAAPRRPCRPAIYALEKPSRQNKYPSDIESKLFPILIAPLANTE